MEKSYLYCSKDLFTLWPNRRNSIGPQMESRYHKSSQDLYSLRENRREAIIS